LENDDVATAIDTLVHRHGITPAADPVDTFVDAVTRLCSDVEVTLDHIECLLNGLTRAGVISDEQRFELHAGYLRQKARDVRTSKVTAS